MILTSSIASIDSRFNPYTLDSEKVINETHLEKCLAHSNSVASESSSSGVSFASCPQSGKSNEAFVTVSDPLGLTIAADFSDFGLENQTLNTTTYDWIDMHGLSHMDETGRPDLPRLTRHIEVPHGVDVAVESVQATGQTFWGYNIGPANPFGITYHGSESSPIIPIELDDVYTTDAFYPFCLVSLTGNLEFNSINLRGRRILEVNIYPIQYHPLDHNLKVHSNVIVKLNYSQPAQIMPPKSPLICRTFENIFERLLLNYKSWVGAPVQGVGESIPPLAKEFVAASQYPPRKSADYLIIVNDTYKAEAKRLADWKNRTGLLTRLYTASDVVEEVQGVGPGVTDDDIRNFIQSAYDTWSLAPIYVLLFGDSDDIPTNYKMIHTVSSFYDQSNGYVGSDLSYFTVDGNDYIPDIIYGRISVNSKDEAETVVTKILSYERSPIDDLSFYKNVLSAAFFEDEMGRDDKGDGIENTGYEFTQYAVAVRDYLDNLGYEVHENYSAKLTRDWIDPWSFTEYYGVPFPPRLKMDNENGFKWINETDYEFAVDNITANFNDGRFLIYFVDHGGSRNMYYIDPPGFTDDFEGWYAPTLNSTDVTELKNGPRLPLVISIGCNTGWFDGETDQEAMGPLFSNNEECLSELLLRKSDGGAVAVIAASRVIINQPADALLRGVIHAFWPDFLETPIQPIYEMGAALYYGRLNVLKEYTYHGPPDGLQFDMTNLTFRLFHLFGDPTTPLWTGQPAKLNVSYPAKIGTEGIQRIVVKVNDSAKIPVEMAKVCLQKGSEVYQVGHTNSRGYVVFEFDATTGGKMNITVTKHNFTPHVEEIEVIQSSATILIDPQRAAVDEAIKISVYEFSTAVTVYFGDHEIPIAAVPQFTTVPTGNLGPINVIANQSDGRTATTVFYRLPNVDIDVFVHRWSSYDNPCISFYPVTDDGIGSETDSQQIEINQEYEVHVTVYNDGCDDAEETDVRLSYAHFGAGFTWLPGEKDIITVNGYGENTAKISWTPTITGHTCVRIKVFHDYDLDLGNNIGQVNAEVIFVQSPGNVNFHVRNPENTTQYMYLELRQEGNYSDVWNASIRGYSSHAIPPHENESIEFFVDVPSNASLGDWRIFIVNVYVKCELIGGVLINVTKGPPPTTTTTTTSATTTNTTTPPIDSELLIIILTGAGGAVVVIIIVIIVSKKRSSR